MTHRTILFSLATLLFLSSCKKEQPTYTNTTSNTNWTTAHTYYLQNMDSAIYKLKTLQAVGFQSDSSQQLFAQARLYFKKAEPFASYLNPEVGHRANGPALPIYLE